MKKLNRIISCLVATSLLGANAAAAEADVINSKAEVMYQLNLIRGVSNTGYDMGLDMSLTREAAVAAVLRVTGHEDKVYKDNYTCSFTDVSEWAKPYVAYGEAIGLCRGINGAYFGAMENVSIRQLCTMYLRMLGYEVGGDIYENALETAKPLSLCNETADRVGNRSDLVDISYNALYISSYGTTTALVRSLADSGIVSLYSIAATGDDGLISAYYSSDSASTANTEELKGDLENAMSYKLGDNTGIGMSLITDAAEAEQASLSCRKMAEGESISFRLDDSYISASDKYFTLVVKYFDNGADRIRVAYNVANMPYCSSYILKTNTNTWKEARVIIRNAQFTHAQDDGADISIIAENEGGNGVEEYISEVMLVKQSVEDQPVNPLEVEPVITEAYIAFDGMGQSAALIQTTGGEAWYGHTKQTEMGGESCISIGVGKRCVLQLDDDFMDADENNCQIKITYFDNGTNKLRVSYSTESKRYADIHIQKTGTDAWITQTINLTDASFMNRQDEGMDISIWGVSKNDSVTGSETEYISRFEIIKK